MKTNFCKIRGIIPPLVTPLKDSITLDERGMERLIEHVLRGGVHGIFILGTTGEGPSLGSKLKRQVIKLACSICRKQIPVYVGVSDTSFAETLRLSEYAWDCGATALVLAPPYYFPTGQAELLEYFEHLVPELPLPLILYNMPAMTKINFEINTLKILFKMKGIIGMKDSSGNMIYLHRIRNLLEKNKKISLLVGPEELLAEAVLFGCDGGICGGANIFPKLYVSLYQAAEKGDLNTVRSLHSAVIKIGDLLYGVGHYNSRVIKGIKCALSCLNICDDFMSEPFHRFRDKERRKIELMLKQLGKDFELI